MTSDKVTVKVLFLDQNLIFHLNLIDIDTEDAIRQKLIALTPEEKKEKEYLVNVGILAEHSCELPQRSVFEDGMEVVKPLVEDAKTAKEAVEKYFADKNGKTTRIANYAVHAFSQALMPHYDFF